MPLHHGRHNARAWSHRADAVEELLRRLPSSQAWLPSGTSDPAEQAATAIAKTQSALAPANANAAIVPVQAEGGGGVGVGTVVAVGMRSLVCELRRTALSRRSSVSSSLRLIGKYALF